MRSTTSNALVGILVAALVLGCAGQTPLDERESELTASADPWSDEAGDQGLFDLRTVSFQNSNVCDECGGAEDSFESYERSIGFVFEIANSQRQRFSVETYDQGPRLMARPVGRVYRADESGQPVGAAVSVPVAAEDWETACEATLTSGNYVFVVRRSLAKTIGSVVVDGVPDALLDVDSRVIAHRVPVAE